MEMTPKLPRKSLSLTSRLKSRSSASPSPRNRLAGSVDPSSPIAIPNDGGIEGTPPHRKFTFNFPYSPSNDTDFSPRSRLSQSSNNSPDVTWKWTQDDQSAENSSITSRSTPNSTNIRELRKKRSMERKEELRKAELEKRKAIKIKREDVLKKQCEQMELIIAKKCTAIKSTEKDFIENKRLSSDSSGFCSKENEEDLFNDSAFDGILEIVQTDLDKPSASLVKKNITPRTKKLAEPVIIHESSIRLPTKDKDLDLLDDSESEGFLLEASQQVETSIEAKTKKSCTKGLERSFEEIPVDKEKSSNYDFLQDSFDDCFALVDDDVFAAEAKKPRTSLQRYKSMPTESPTSKAAPSIVKSSPDTSKIRRYPSSSTIRPNSKARPEQVALETNTSGDKTFTSLQRTINRALRFGESEELSTASQEGLLIRADRLIQVWDKANEIFLQLVEIAEDGELTLLEDQMENMESEYFKTAEIYKKQLAVLAQDAREATAASEEDPQRKINVNLTLPVQQHDRKNTWGEFDGTLLKWIGFRDRFVAAIHNDKEMSNAYKYSYLRKSLTGKAEKALGESQLSENSYQEAWDRLVHLYEKPYHIAKEHLNQFYRLPDLQEQPTSAELLRMSNVTYETVRQLRALEVPVEHWDMVFIFGLHDRLDAETRKQWELARTSETPKLTEFLDFLDKQAGALETTRMVPRSQSSAGTASGSGSHQFTRRYTTSRPGGSGLQIPVSPCEACAELHPLYRCPDFNALNLNGRREFVSRRGICPNCLKKGHRKERCTAIQCRNEKCWRNPRHNSMLCPIKQQESNVLALRMEDARKDNMSVKRKA